MKLIYFSKILLAVSLLVLVACPQKTDDKKKPVVVIKKNSAVVNYSWQWDDKQKYWTKNETVFKAEIDNLATDIWNAQKKAISLSIKSEKLLNTFDNAPNALLMKIFQLSDPTAFLKSAQSSIGLRRLLTAESIDPACIDTEKLLILPGRKQNLTLDRAEGTRYLGIVLGYSNLKQAQIFRLIPIVITRENHPALLNLELFLGTDGINSLNINTNSTTPR